MWWSSLLSLFECVGSFPSAPANSNCIREIERRRGPLSSFHKYFPFDRSDPSMVHSTVLKNEST